jgi:hypothetical protein
MTDAASAAAGRTMVLMQLEKQQADGPSWRLCWPLGTASRLLVQFVADSFVRSAIVRWDDDST